PFASSCDCSWLRSRATSRICWANFCSCTRCCCGTFVSLTLVCFSTCVSGASAVTLLTTLLMLLTFWLTVFWLTTFWTTEFCCTSVRGGATARPAKRSAYSVRTSRSHSRPC